MEVRIGGKKVYGTIMPVEQGTFELHATRTHYAGLNGISEITIGTGARQIDVPMIVHRRYTAAQVIAELKKLQRGVDDEGYIGLHATVTVVSDALRREYKNTTYDGFQLMDGPLPDIAGTLGGGWFVEGVLRFTQLK